MKTLGDFTDHIPNGPGCPVEESYAKQYGDIVIAEGATSFYFFDATTGDSISLADLSSDQVWEFCLKFAALLEREDCRECGNEGSIALFGNEPGSGNDLCYACGKRERLPVSLRKELRCSEEELYGTDGLAEA